MIAIGVIVLACTVGAFVGYHVGRHWAITAYADNQPDGFARIASEHLARAPRDTLSKKLAGEVIAVRYRSSGGHEEEWTGRVHQVFREFGNPYVAIGSTEGVFVKRLDRILHLVTANDERHFDCLEDWFDARGIEFTIRGKRSPSSVPLNTKFVDKMDE